MYPKFMEAVLAYLKAIDAISNSTEEDSEEIPYLNHVPVISDRELVGFLRDEVGGAYCFMPATETEQDWWALRPWANQK